MAWIDLVPGGRAALSWVQGKSATFLAQGPALERQLVEADRVWNNLPPPPRTAEQYAVLNRWVVLRNAILADISEYRRLEPGVRWIASVTGGDEPPTLPPALGAFPVVALIAAVSFIVTVQFALKQWLDARPTRTAALSQLMSDSVAAGLISPVDAGKVIDAGGRSWTEDLAGVLKWGAVAVAGVVLLQVLLPPPSRRRR